MNTTLSILGSYTEKQNLKNVNHPEIKKEKPLSEFHRKETKIKEKKNSCGQTVLPSYYSGLSTREV